MSEEKAVQHIGDPRPGATTTLCGAVPNPELAGPVVQCPACVERFREHRGRKG